MADRWQPWPKSAWLQRATAAYYKRMFRNYVPDTTVRKTDSLTEKQQIHVDNTRISTYVWLPVEWEDGMPVIRWHDEWKIEDYLTM